MSMWESHVPWIMPREHPISPLVLDTQPLIFIYIYSSILPKFHKIGKSTQVAMPKIEMKSGPKPGSCPRLI